MLSENSKKRHNLSRTIQLSISSLGGLTSKCTCSIGPKRNSIELLSCKIGRPEQRAHRIVKLEDRLIVRLHETLILSHELNSSAWQCSPSAPGSTALGWAGQPAFLHLGVPCDSSQEISAT